MSDTLNAALLLPLRTAFDRHEWYVAPTSFGTAKALVQRFHYARDGAPNAIYTFGLFLHGDINCWGVSWWLPAAKGSVDKYNRGGYATTLSLHRLVVHPLVPTNGASFLLGGSIRAIASDGRHDLLVTYADTWRGHTGAIYKATNWNYRGLSDPLAVWLNADGNQRGTKYGDFGERSASLSADELAGMGCRLVGRFPKHVYTMALKLKPQMQQLDLFAAVPR